MSLSCLASFPFFISPFWYKWLCKVTEKEVYILLSILQDLENSERLQRGTWCYLVYPRVHQASPRSLPSTPAGSGFLMAVVLHPAAHREISQVSKEASACVGNSFKMSPRETRGKIKQGKDDRKISQFNLKSAVKRSVSVRTREGLRSLLSSSSHPNHYNYC